MGKMGGACECSARVDAQRMIPNFLSVYLSIGVPAVLTESNRPTC
jgi:hypothetical protein